MNLGLWELLCLAALSAMGLFPFHVIICRIKRSLGFVDYSLKLSLIFLCVLCGILIFYFRLGVVSTAIFAFFFVSLWNAYLIFIINLLNSFSLRMLREIVKAPNEVLPKEKIDEIFPDKVGYQARLFAMENGGLIERSPGSYEQMLKITPKGSLIAAILLLTRKILSIKVVG